jgi:hypothetical protein
MRLHLFLLLLLVHAKQRSSSIESSLEQHLTFSRFFTNETQITFLFFIQLCSPSWTFILVSLKTTKLDNRHRKYVENIRPDHHLGCMLPRRFACVMLIIRRQSFICIVLCQQVALTSLETKHSTMKSTKEFLQQSMNMECQKTWRRRKSHWICSIRSIERERKKTIDEIGKKHRSVVNRFDLVCFT